MSERETDLEVKERQDKELAAERRERRERLGQDPVNESQTEIQRQDERRERLASASEPSSESDPVLEAFPSSESAPSPAREPQ